MIYNEWTGQTLNGYFLREEISLLSKVMLLELTNKARIIAVLT